MDKNVEAYRRRVRSIRDRICQNPSIMFKLLTGMNLNKIGEGSNRTTYKLGLVSLDDEIVHLALKKYKDVSPFRKTCYMDLSFSRYGTICLPEKHPIHTRRHTVTQEHAFLSEANCMEELSVYGKLITDSYIDLEGTKTSSFFVLVNNCGNLSSIVEDLSQGGEKETVVVDELMIKADGIEYMVDLEHFARKDPFDASFFYLQRQNRIDLVTPNGIMDLLFSYFPRKCEDKDT